MKFLTKYKSFTFLFLFLSFTVFADYKYLSGNDLYTQLTSKNDSDFIIAAEYIAGATNAFMIDPDLCVPKTTDMDQLANLVKKYSINDKALRAQSADEVVEYVLYENYYCKGQKV